MNCNRLAIDLAKNSFQLCSTNERNKVLKNEKVSRSNLLDKVRNINPKIVSMEACYSAHYWGRTFQKMGIKVELIPAQHVTPFVRGNKNDSNDALAIIEAAQRPNIRPVTVKSIEQQDIQLLLRVRERKVAERTSLANQIRGLLSEYGVVINKTIKALNDALPSIVDNKDNELTPVAREVFSKLYDEFKLITEEIKFYGKKIELMEKNNDTALRLRTIPGFGPLLTAAFICSVGNGASFKNGREVSAWLGLTPKQHASGDMSKLGSITKRGNRYLRTLMIHGARAVMNWAGRKKNPLNRWIVNLAARIGNNKAVVALANKLARIAWVVANKGIVYNEKLAAK